MGFNLELGCLSCKERAFVFRGQEAMAIRQFAALHWRGACEKTSAIDNGFSDPEWVSEHGWAEISLPPFDDPALEARLVESRDAMKRAMGYG